MTKEESRLLEKAARLFTNLGNDSTLEEKRNAYREELKLLEELEIINPELAEECGIRYSREIVESFE